MKEKQNLSQSEVCFDFNSKYNSMKTIINSLETISAKCELFFRQFNVKFDNQNQLDDYKKLLTGFKSELGSEYLRQPTDEKQQAIAIRSDDFSGNESDFVTNASDNDFDDFYDQFNDMSDSFGLQGGDQSIVDELSDKIVDYYQKDKSGNHIKHYGCPITDCEFKSTVRNTVVAHLAKHTNDRNQRCQWPNCEKTFGYRNSLISHIESYHLRKERFKCCVEGCGQCYTSKVNFQIHMNNNHYDILNHQCLWTECHLNYKTCACLWPKCGQQFLNKQLLDNHMEDIHLKRTSNEDSIEELKADQWLKCDQNDCDFQTVSEQDLTEHKTQHKSKYIPINRRKQMLEKEDYRGPNVNKYTGKPLTKRRRPKNFQCSWPACEATFESQHTVAIHMRKHTGEKPFECDWPECGKRFRFKGALKLHKESIHLKLKQFKCDQCDEAFLLLTALTVHKSKHTGIKRLQCDWPGCEWRTNFSQQLDIHRMRTHEGKKVYLKKYKTKNKSDPHSPYDADGKLKPFTCEWPGCERRFKFECNLEPHMRWHQKTENEPNAEKKKSGSPRKPREPKIPKEKKEKVAKPTAEKAWRCDWPNCQSSYTTKNMLSQHFNIHTGQRPYRCDSCDQAFAYKSSLSSHIATNHPPPDQMVDRPFKCQYFGCNRSFDKPRALMAHQRIAHHFKVEKSGTPPDPIEEYSSSTCYSSPPQQMPIPEPYIFQKNVIRLDRIKAFNALQIQTHNQNLMSYPTTYRRERLTSTPAPQTTHTTAKKLLTNALKRPRTQALHSSPIDSEAIARELPHPCSHAGCWRRFKTMKALEWHLKKFHEQNTTEVTN